MPRSTHPASPRRRLAGLVAALLYVATAGVLPVLHAETEDLTSAPTVEETHSTQCNRIHSDISCPATGLFRALPTRAVPRPEPPAVRPTAPPPVPHDRHPQPGSRSARHVRGPPAA